jgi:hypothetical protein
MYEGDVRGINPAAVVEEYDRRKLARLSDRELADAVGDVVSDPLATEATVTSFALHAPLELLARASLLSFVAPHARRVARLRIVAVAARYEQAGARLARPDEIEEASPEVLAEELGLAISRGDLAAVDAFSGALGARCSPERIRRILAADVLDRLGAAGHANIYFDLVRAAPLANAGRLFRPLARELAKSPERRMAIPAVIDSSPERRGSSFAAVISKAPLLGAPSDSGIAPLVEHAEHAGLVADLLAEIGPELDARPGELAQELLRVAASMMLQGPPEHAPYGWTHCLTLSQAALASAGDGAPPAQAIATAATYVAAFWSALAERPFNPGAPSDSWLLRPDALTGDLGQSMSEVRGLDEPDATRITRDLASRAAIANDAHHVKYTLACLRAAEADPAARSTFLAAATCLADWWRAHPDDNDLLAEQLPVAAGRRGRFAALVA